MGNTAQSLARVRIQSLLDPNSFVEIGGSVTARNTDFGLAKSAVPSDGVVTGYGVIGGKLVYVYSQDVSVLNGTVGEMHAKKITSLYDLALKIGAPVVGLLDCGGIRLQEATDALNALGEIYQRQVMASGVIPQIMGIFGSCGGGMAISAALADFTFMVQDTGRLFINAPDTLDGNHVDKCDTADASFQASQTGLVDGVGPEDEVIGQIRDMVGLLPSNNEDDLPYNECGDDLNRTCPGLADCAEDTSLVLAQIADNREFFETKADYGKDMVTGFLRLNGNTVGCVANRSAIYDEEGKPTEEFGGVLSARGAEKAAGMVNFCDAYQIPLLTLTNVSGFRATKCSEKRMAKAVGGLTYAFANATVPKVNVIVGKAYGSAYVAMNSKAIGADVVFAWSIAEVGTMEASMAAKIMYPGADADTWKVKTVEYQALQSNVLSAARRGYVDTVIEPANTRKYVIGAFEMLYTKREERIGKKHGTI